MWNVANTLRASVLDNSKFWQRFHGWLTLGWFLQFPLVLWWKDGLKDSVSYLVIISIAAAALGQMSAWQAARVEVKLDKEGK